MAYKLKGLDNGYLYTKDNSHNIFKSAFSCTQDILAEDNKITINDKDYYFGVGNTCTDIDKIDSEVNFVCTLANLAMSGDGDYIIMANLPIVQYKTKKIKFENQIMSYNNNKLVYKDKIIKYNIAKVEVLPQGIVPIYSINPNSESIVIDIGSNTINFCLLEYVDGKLKITKHDTKFKGLLHLYKKVITEINAKFDLNYTDIKAQYFLEGHPLIDENGAQKDTSFIKLIIKDYILDILSDFKLDFPYKSVQIYLCGGGAELLYPIFQNNFPSCIKIPNSQFANADGLYARGKQLYQKYL